MNTEDDTSWFYFTITDAKLIAKNFIDGMEEIVTASPCSIGFQCKQVPILFFVRFIFRKDDIAPFAFAIYLIRQTAKAFFLRTTSLSSLPSEWDGLHSDGASAVLALRSSATVPSSARKACISNAALAKSKPFSNSLGSVYILFPISKYCYVSLFHTGKLCLRSYQSPP